MADRPRLLRRLFSAILRRQLRKNFESVRIPSPHTPAGALLGLVDDLEVVLFPVDARSSRRTGDWASRRYIVMYTASVKNLIPIWSIRGPVVLGLAAHHQREEAAVTALVLAPVIEVREDRVEAELRAAA